jgi:hypothetical protein
MSIGVGINENVYISAVELDSNNYLNIQFKQKSDIANPFEALQADDVIDAKDTLDVKLFAPTPRKNDDGKFTEAKLVDFVTTDINKTKGIIQHLLAGYVPKEQYAIGKAIFDGCGMDATNYAERLLNKDVMLQIHKNLSNHLISVLRPFIGDSTKLFRLLLIRTSKDKHFATFRSTRLEENPFWEDMDVPKEASKLAFSAYEIKEGLNDGTPSSRTESADKPKTEPANTMTAASVFGGQ